MKDTELKENLLKNWEIIRHWDGNIVICGEIYNDTKKRFVDGSCIRTSRVESIDFVSGIVKTKNSIYNLEKRSRQ